MTDAVFATMEAMTGERPMMCPWRAFNDVFVQRVLDLFSDREDGNLAWACARPSRRLVHGVRHFARVLNRIRAWQDEQERKQSEPQGFPCR